MQLNCIWLLVSLDFQLLKKKFWYLYTYLSRHKKVLSKNMEVITKYGNPCSYSIIVPSGLFWAGQLFSIYMYFHILGWTSTFGICASFFTACFCLLVRGPMLLWQQLVPGDLMGDQLTGPQFLHWSKVAHPRDGAAEKEFFGFAFNASG